VALAFGLRFWLALARGRKADWPARLRTANFHLGLFVCGLALVLALPVLDFGAISTRNQLARLQSSAVPAEAFDYAALRWDFGEAGQRALERRADRGGPEVAEFAEAALAQTERIYRYDGPLRTADDFEVRVQPDEAGLRRLVL